jgi:hypothetical protein
VLPLRKVDGAPIVFCRRGLGRANGVPRLICEVKCQATVGEGVDVGGRGDGGKRMREVVGRGPVRATGIVVTPHRANLLFVLFISRGVDRELRDVHKSERIIRQGGLRRTG